MVAGLCYAIATIVLTWPLFRHPATTVLDTQSLYGDASILVQRDINLTVWALAWDAHALTTDPLHLFDANAFFPARLTLAFSEHRLGNVPFAGPVFLLTGNAVLGHQVALFASFVLCGLAMAVYVLYWTGDRMAALAGGFVFTFAPYRFWQLASLDIISLQYLPLVMLGIDGVLDRVRPRLAAAALIAALVLSTTCSYYVGYAAFVLAAVYALGGLAGRGRSALPRAAPLLVAGAVSATFLAVLTVPYVLLQRSGDLPNYTRSDFASFGFRVMTKFGVRGLLSWFVLPKHEGIPQFLTWGALAAAVPAVVWRRRRPVGSLLAVAITGVVLGLGPSAASPTGAGEISLPYAWLAAIVPGFSAMRAPLRFGALTTLGVAALASLGIAAVRSRLARRSWSLAARLVPIVVVVAVLVQAIPGGLAVSALETGAALPEGVRWLAEHGDGGPLLNLPTDRVDLLRESRYMVYSTAHWLPMVNGYSSYPPAGFLAVVDAAARLPDPAALDDVLRLVPLRWILFDRTRTRMLPKERDAYDRVLSARLRVAHDSGGDVVYEVPR